MKNKIISQFKSLHLATLAIIIFVAGFPFIAPRVAFATTLYSQTNSSNFWDMNTNMVGTAPYQGFKLSSSGTGFTGTWGDSLTMEIAVENQHINGSTSYVWDLRKCDNSDYTSCLVVASFDTPVASQYVRIFTKIVFKISRCIITTCGDDRINILKLPCQDDFIFPSRIYGC